MSGSDNIFLATDPDSLDQPIIYGPQLPNRNWLYPTPLEPLEAPHFLYDRVVEINGMKFQRRSDCKYKVCPYKLVDELVRLRGFTPEQQKAEPLQNEINLVRNVIQQDLWFLVYFVMRNPLANHPFVIQACKEIQAETGDSLEEWARDHLKTTIISARQVQKVLNDPERRIALFSATRPLAIKIQNLIKSVLESQIIVECFYDIVYENPSKDAPKWSEAPEGGLIVKRKGFYKEATFSSWGLIEGMPTGDHYTDMVFDDIVVQDQQGPEITAKVCDNFDMAENIGTRDRQITVVGTPYRHDDALAYIRGKTDPVTGKKLFKHRKKPATVDGTFNGKSVFLPEATLAKKRAGKIYFFFCQQLIDPTPRGFEKLNPDHLILVPKRSVPEGLYKFMMIDPSGDKGRRQDRAADAWAMMVVGVRPFRDGLGQSDVYILDMLIREMDLFTAQKEAVDMVCRNGRILKLGIEKVGQSTMEIHICSALRARKRFYSVEAGNLEILKPGGRSKELRIESAVSWPLKNGKIHIVDTVPIADRNTFALEMEKFPAGKDNGLDGFSYVYDIIKNYRFSDEPFLANESKKESPYDEAFRRAREARSSKDGWIRV